MTDKPQWIKDVMREIEYQYASWDQGCLETIKAIILKHCPQDKVEKLVEAAIKAKELMRIGVWNREEFKCVLNELQAALDNYEKEKRGVF